LPALDRLFGVPRRAGNHPEIDAGERILLWLDRAALKAPADCRDLARLMARYHGDIRRGPEMRPATLVALLEKTDALRRPQRFLHLLQARTAAVAERLGREE
jgi:tRNA nucleotidyltransferase (CCA-adding enzyme)